MKNGEKWIDLGPSVKMAFCFTLAQKEKLSLTSFFIQHNEALKQRGEESNGQLEKEKMIEMLNSMEGKYK